MTPGATRARALVLAAALLLAFASGPARAGDLYQWVTEDGRVEIGTSPPKGVAARPWFPGQEAAAQPATPPAAAPPTSPAPARASASRPRASSGRTSQAEGRPRSRLEGKCLQQQQAIEKATQKTRILESQIARLEKKLDELEATELAYSQTSCRSMDVYGPDASDCISSSFHRDAEISRTQQELEEAQQKLGDLEQRARSASEDGSCAPTAPQK